MDVSIIIPTYKRPQKLEKLIISLLKQRTDLVYEIIVVDDGVQADTEEICKKYNVKYLRTKGNEGPGKARDLGSVIAEGKVLAFIDDDELASENWVDSLFSSYKRGFEVVYGPIETDIPPMYPFIHSFKRGKGVIPVGNLGISRSLFNEIGGFSSFLSSFAEDWFIREKLRRRNTKIAYNDRMLVYHPPIIKLFIKKDFFKDKFLYFLNSIHSRKMIKIYPLERVFNHLLMKNLFVFLWFFLSISKKGITGFLLFFFLPNLLYFVIKNLRTYNIAKSKGLIIPKVQIIFYTIFSFLNPVVDFFSFIFSFCFYVILYIILKKEYKLKSAEACPRLL